MQLSATDAEAAAPLGRVVALGDSLASGQALGPQVPGSIADCGRSTGGYPEVAMSRVTHGTWVNATCNATTTDNFQYGWTGPSGATVPPQYDSLNRSEDLVIVGSGNNEAFFGKIAYDCTGYQPAVDAFFHNRDYPQQPAWPIPNHCSDTYLVNGVNQIPNYVAAGKPKVAAALTRIHQLSPNAKIILVGKPRLAKPSGSQCFNSEFWLTATDAPLYATWEDGSRQAMIDTVNAFNSSVPGNYAHFVDMQGISGTSHTGCETNWSDRWINPHTWQSGPQYTGIPLHHTPLGASVTANAIIDAIHAAGFDTGSTPTNPVVSISSPASGTLTTNATIPVSFSATDNIRIASCSITSGASVALSPGTNTIVVACLDDAGNSGSKSVTVMRDASPPVISISSPANGSGTTAASAQLVYTATDDVGTPSCTPASGTTFALSTGANTLSVSCTDSVGRVATSAITVYRGTPPVVAINAPADGTKTASATVNVSYTVNGTAAIPGGTSCKVNGAASGSATTNSAALAIGINSVVVDCTNVFGSGSSSVTVNRGNAPVVAITAPADGLKTTATTVNATYTVGGSSSIPAGTSCTVNGSASASASSNNVPLALGGNAITVACTNAFGSGSAAITVTRGAAPSVAISAPSNGLNTAAASVNVTYAVDGGSSIPAGTSCTVNGSASASASSNSAGLALGANEITVACTNAFASSNTAVTVTRGNPPAIAITAPADALKTTATTVNATYTVDGSSSIPAGTSCTVNGTASASASSNSVSLALGANAITVACTNAFGSSSTEITVTRGVAPVVAIVVPVNNTVTSAASVNAVFSLNGGSSIASGTACSVNGVATTDASTNSVALGMGSNAITVTCSSAFGTDADTVTVVRGTGPSVVITAPGNGLSTTASSINVAFTVNGAASIPNGTTCSVNGAPTISSEANAIALALGANTIDVACSNALGDDTQSVIVYRGNPPAVAITAPADGITTTASSTNVSFIVDGAAAIPSGTNCTVDGSSASSASVNAVPLQLGATTIAVACTNDFGSSIAAVTVTRVVEPDTTAPLAPTVTRTNPSTSPTSSPSQTVTYTGAETEGTFQCKLDVGPSAPCQASPITINNLPDGNHTIAITQTDSSGNVSPAGTATWTVDSIPPSAPTVTRTAPQADPTPLPTQTITYIGAEVGGSFQCKRDNETYAACPSSPISISGLGEGPHSYSIKQIDAAGNIGSVATVAWTVDSSPPSAPVVTRTAPTANPTNLRSQSIAYNGELGGILHCKLDDEAYAICPSSPLTRSNLPVGSRSFSVRQTDAAGNVGPATTVSWSIDTTPPIAPTVTRTNPTATPTNSTSQAITLGGLEPGATTQCKLDATDYSPCGNSPFTLSGLAAGTHTLSVTQTDSAGNVGPATSVTWVIDLTPPPTPIVSGPSGTYGLSTASISYSDSEPGVTFQCKLDAASYEVCPPSPISLIGVPEGPHTYFVTATDAAGNTSTPGTAVWTVDTTSFLVSITSAPASLTTSTSASFEFVSTIASGTSYECKLDDDAYSSCSSAMVYGGLDDGSHTFTVRGVNGVQTTPESSRTWIIDSTAPAAPTITRASPTNTPTNSDQQTLSILGSEPGGVLSCKVNGSAYQNCPSSPVILSELTDGLYEFSVTQTDPAGNVGPAATVTWIVDTIAPSAPSVVRTIPSADPTSATAQTFSIGGESGSTIECKLDQQSYVPCNAGTYTVTGLALGTHVLAVKQTDAAGNPGVAAAVAWTIALPPPDPPDPPGDVSAFSAKITSLKPRTLFPARRGSPFSLKSRGSRGSFRVNLSAPATVSLRLERVASGRSRRATSWMKFKLKAGKTRIYMTGRTGKKVLAPGTYKVHLKANGGNADAFSPKFKIKR